MNTSQLIDPYNRNLNYLRVSVTDRCNLRCIYCTPPSRIEWIPHEEILRYEEILKIVRVGACLGIRKLRITGGEPLVRKGIYPFLAELGKISGIDDIALTTNGVLLKKNVQKLKNAGIRRLNISLDTLDREKYRDITGRDHFHAVWEGIEAAHTCGFHPIKINAVAMNGINDNEILELARLSLAYPFHIRFIELMPIGESELMQRTPLLAQDIMKRVEELGELMPVPHEAHDGPAERFRLKNAKGEIGFIRPLSHHFCAQCNRLRLTANGALRPCLLSDQTVDMKTPLRQGASEAELAEIFFRAIRMKPRAHRLEEKCAEPVRDIMSSIGG